MVVYLEPVRGGQRIPLDKAITFFGRHAECDVVLARSRKVSRKHCCIAQVGKRLMIRDLGSMNGIKINDQRIRSEAEIRPGDEIVIGDVAFSLKVRKDQPRPAERSLGKRDPGQNVRFRGEASRRAAPQPESDRYLSQEYPVPIPEGDNSFEVVGSSQDVSDRDDSIPLCETLGADDEKDVADFDGDVIVVEESSEFRDSGSHFGLIVD